MKAFKKIFAAVLAGMMAAAMSASAFAESGKTKDECNTTDFDRLVEELTSLTAELEIMKVQDSKITQQKRSMEDIHHRFPAPLLFLKI